MADYCAYSDLPVGTCACPHCTPADVHEEHRPVDSAPFIARFPGTCHGCGFAIRAGVDRVAYRNDRLVHDDHRRCQP